MTKEDKAKLKEQINQLVEIKNKSKLVTALTHYFEDKADEEFEYKINLASQFYEANLSTFKETGQTALNHLLEMFLDDRLAVNTETKEILIHDGSFYAKAPGVDIGFAPENIEERLNMMIHMASSNGGTIKDIIDENIVKRACKELGITQDELYKNSNMRLEVAIRLILKSSVHDSDTEYADIVADQLENITSEKDVRSILEDAIMNTNIVKSTCKKLGITYRELAEAIGYSESSVRSSASTKISEQMQKAIELYLETIELKKQLKSTEILKQALKDLIK